MCEISIGSFRPIRQVFDAIHPLTHPSIRATRWLILSSFVWKRCSSDVARVSDPDSDPHSNCGSGPGSRMAKMTHKNRKKSKIFLFLNTGCSLLRAEGFSCSLEIFYGGLGISELQFLIKKI